MFLHLQMINVKEFSFEKLTSFSIENIVEDSPASHFDCVFTGNACVFSFYPDRPFYSKVNDWLTWKYWQVGSILFVGNNGADSFQFLLHP
jgi:hypothetical protein